jgi:magnesium-transporting ATPase (P-type)
MALVIFFFIASFSILTLWYLAGLYLLLLGWFLLLDDGDILVGFLWVIDLGVGLIFFIFVLHYTTFLHQKSNLDKTSREFSYSIFSSLLFLSFFAHLSPVTGNWLVGIWLQIWSFLLSWYNYYGFFYSATITDLNLLHEIYFVNNSFEFFLINFFLLYGIISSIFLSFLIKRFFNFVNFAQFLDYPVLVHARHTYFIRSQDYIKQQSMSAGLRVWLKVKNTIL